MANKVAFEVVVTSKGFKVVQQEQGKLAKSIDNTDKKTKNLGKTQDKQYGRQKQGVIQTANQTKNFSKLSQTIGGSGGTSLVGAYATLAANVFAASAAFNALSRAAEFQKLREGLEIVGNQSGRTLSILADNLREATGMALTLEEASSAAALGISGGFGEVELEGLAKVAKGAALTLGRNLPDAFDRLTRGAIKLEPEILDELGIMVRLDDAVEKYAAQLGKSASSLTQMERRQAFMNEILEQGTAKFGDIAEAADPTAYQKLGATFGDLTKEIFNFFNETLMLNSVIGLLANSTTALFGTMLIFGSTIATQIVPALGTMSQKAAERAAESAADSKALVKESNKEIKSLKKKTKEFKLGSKGYNDAKKMEGSATDKLRESIKKLELQEKRREASLKRNFKEGTKRFAQKEAEIRQVKRQLADERKLLALREGQGGKQIAAKIARTDAVFQGRQAQSIAKFTSGEVGLSAAMALNAKAFDKKKKRTLEAIKNMGFLSRANEKLKLRFAGLTKNIGLFTASFVKFLPIIGVTLVAIGALAIAFDRFYNTKERKAYNKSFKELDKILDGLPDKAKEYNKALNGSGNAGALQLRTSAILSNQITEINDKLQESIEKRNELGDDGVASLRGTGAFFANIDRNALGGRESPANILEQEVKAIEKIVGTRLPRVAETSRKALRTAVKIQDSVEIKALEEILTSDIPEYVNAAKDTMGSFNDALSKGDGVLALEEASKVVERLQERFGKLNAAIASFNQTLTDAEKIGSQFIQKFLPKTSTTDIINTFNTFAQNIEAIEEETKRSGTDTANTLAAAFSATGSSIGALLGGTFLELQTNFNVAKSQLDTAKAEQEKFQNMGFLGKRKAAKDAGFTGIGAVGKLEEQLDTGVSTAETAFKTTQKPLSDEGSRAFEETREVLIEINKLEILRKAKLEQIKNIQKISKNIVGQSAQAGTLQNKVLDDQLQLRKDTFDTGNRILANQLKITTEQEEELGLIGALQLKRMQMVGDKEKALEVSKIDLQIQEQENILFQQKMNAAQQVANISNAQIAIDKTALKLAERQVGFEQKLTAVRLEREAISRGQNKADPIATLIAELQGEQDKVKFAKEKARIELASARVQNALLAAQLKAMVEMGKMSLSQANSIIDDADIVLDGLSTQLNKEIDNASKTAVPALEKAFAKTFGGDLVSKNLSKGIMAAFLQSSGAIATLDQQLIVAGSTLRDFGQTMVDTFGEDGAVVGALSNFSASLVEIGPTISQAFAKIDDATGPQTIMGEDGKEKIVQGLSEQSAGLLKYAAIAETTGAVLSSFGQLMQADSNRRIAAIDSQIEAEKRIDGKSAESLARIKALEGKKLQLQRKSFEQQKKIQMAQVIASTAAAVMQTMAASGVGFFATPMAMLVAAMGAAQLAIIRKTQFDGGGGGDVSAPNTALTIGGRSNAVDVGQRATGGELSYLRGDRGVGTNANNFNPGGAMGRKGYANGADGITVGERGPEVITPSAPIDIIPNYALGGQAQNINFNISAVDGASVQNMLNEQQGNIIAMIRQAANDNGEGFLESVDSDVYGGGG